MNILILTSVYKDDSLAKIETSTNIVNSFARTWVQLGHNVIVIHNSHCYPYIVHKIPKFIKKRLANKMGFEIADYRTVCKKHYLDNGVDVYRFPIKKYIPHKSPNQKRINKQVNNIITLLKKENYTPDVITGHWASPQTELISRLKKYYGCNTAIVFHGIGYLDNADFLIKNDVNRIGKVGARSLSQAYKIQELLDLKDVPFVCNSGIPDEYLNSYRVNTNKFLKEHRWIITFVGRLVEYKNVDSTIRALAALKDVDWEFNVVGDGASKRSLQNLCDELNVSDKVHFMGKISRDEVMKLLYDSHIFVMISTNEVFGLSYLEAMASSCITIASKNGGVDGIIVSGENGFLCEEGNSSQLIDLLNEVVKMSNEEIVNIAKNAYETSQKYSDTNMAIEYLNNIIK